MVDVPRRSVQAGVELSLLVLAASAVGLAAVDLDSGALLRAARVPGHLDLRPLDVIRARLAPTEEEDPTQPEAVELAGPPTPVGTLGGRRAERWLRPLLHPEFSHLLGFAGPAIPFWELNGDRPSLALLPGRPSLRVDPEGVVHCRFVWRNLTHDLPVADRRVCDAVTRGHDLVKTLGFEPERMVVALTPPWNGHCYKVVASLLPR